MQLQKIYKQQKDFSEKSVKVIYWLNEVNSMLKLAEIFPFIDRSYFTNMNSCPDSEPQKTIWDKNN